MASYEPSFSVADVVPSFTLNVREDRVYTPTGAGAGPIIDGYTLRSGDRLLVIDNTGKIVGLPPEP